MAARPPPRSARATARRAADTSSPRSEPCARTRSPSAPWSSFGILVVAAHAGRQPDPAVPAGVVDRDFGRGKTRVGERPHRHADRALLALFRVVEVRSAHRAEAEPELGPLVAGTHVLRGPADDPPRGGEARQGGEYAARAPLAGEAMAHADPERLALHFD